MKKIIRNKLFLSFILSLCLGTIIVLPGIIAGMGIFSLVADYNLQQVPFGMLINDAIKEGSYHWTWFNDLGSNFIGTFSFYNLFSPFSIIGYLFPAKFYPYLSGVLLILKYAIAGVCSYLFLKRYVKNKNYAIIGSLLYSFSGFQLTNVLFHFHDIVALFPLLLYTLDNLVYDGKRIWFGLVVFLLAITNWYLFIGEVVFVVIYFSVKCITREYKINFRKFAVVFFESLIGTLLASFVLIPSFLFMISNPRITGSWSIVSMFKYPNFGTYVELLRAFLFPPETMTLRAFLTETNYNSVELFLPFVGILFVIAYLIRNYKKWDSILFFVCLLFMVVPILNSSFFLFNTIYYARWFYMPILIMSLLTIKTLDSKQYNIKFSFIINVILYLIFGIACYIYTLRADTVNIIFNKVYFYLFVIVAIISLIGSYFIFSNKICKNKVLMMGLGVFVYISLWGNYMVFVYRGNSFTFDDNYYNYLNVRKQLEISDNTRTNSTSSCLANLGVVGSFSNLKSFNSNNNGSSFEFYNSIGIYRSVSTNIDDKDINSFLGVKYVIDCDKNKVINNYKLMKSSSSYNLYLNEDAKDIGFFVDDYILDVEFFKLSISDRVKLLSNVVVLNKEQIDKYRDLFNEQVSGSIEQFKFLTNGFSATVLSASEKLFVFSIPHDAGWKAKNNGKDIKIEKVDNGLMAIKIEEGVNNIEFSYTVPGLKFGSLISLISVICYSGYFLILKKRKNLYN